MRLMLYCGMDPERERLAHSASCEREAVPDNAERRRASLKRENRDLWFLEQRARILRQQKTQDTPRRGTEGFSWARAAGMIPGEPQNCPAVSEGDSGRAPRKPSDPEQWRARRYAYLRNKGWSVKRALAEVEGEGK